MRVEFRKNRWRTWNAYYGEGDFEQTIIRLLNDIKLFESVLANELETSTNGVIEYTDAITDRKKLLGAILA